MSNADLLIFDLDGTLIDSKRDLADSVNATRAWKGLAPLPLETVSSYVGDGAPTLDPSRFSRRERGASWPTPCATSSNTIASTCWIRPRSTPACARRSTVCTKPAFRWPC